MKCLIGQWSDSKIKLLIKRLKSNYIHRMQNCNRNKMNILLVDVSSSFDLFIFRVVQITQFSCMEFSIILILFDYQQYLILVLMISVVLYYIKYLYYLLTCHNKCLFTLNSFIAPHNTSFFSSYESNQIQFCFEKYKLWTENVDNRISLNDLH